MYVSLHTHSFYSLLDGASSPEALIEQAARFEMPAMAITDHDALYGAVRFSRAATAAGIKPIFGTELTLTNGGHLTLLAETQLGYRNLSRIITMARAGQEKGTAALDWRALTDYSAGLIALSGCRRSEIAQALLSRDMAQANRLAERYAAIFGRDNFFLELQRHHEYGDQRWNEGLKHLAERQKLRLVASTNVHYVAQEQAPIHDILSCIRFRLPIEKAESHLRPNDEFYLRPPSEMFSLFVDTPDAIQSTRDIAERCIAKLPVGPQTFPVPPLPPGYCPETYLKTLCWAGMKRKLLGHWPRRYEETLERELKIIFDQNLTNYFLLVWDVVQFARENKILCQGRGSAANSLVAFLLDITPIDPLSCGLVFERFLSAERQSPADIDVDFASNRREEAIQYLYQRFGAEQIGMACTVNTFGARQALRDVGMVFGFTKNQLDKIVDHLDTHSADRLEHSPRLRVAFGEQIDSEPWQQLIHYSAALDSYPRHLGIHVGGMVIASNPPLIESIPIEPATMKDRYVVQWDKDSLEAANYAKVDILSLRMMSAIEDALDLIEKRTGKRPDLARLKPTDRAVFDMICRGDTLGLFNIESRAQANLIPDFQPRTLADLTIEVALIRPGPVQANMVRPYLDRRNGRAKVTYLHPLLEPVLKDTLGVILFQEDVLKVATAIAGFTPGEGEQLRRALGGKRPAAEIEAFRKRFIAGANMHGVSLAIATKIFEQLKAFGGYSFSKAHAAAFALIAYWSAWLKHYYRAEFTVGLLRNQPMGFYPAHTVVTDAKIHGLKVLNIDLRTSPGKTTMEGDAIRLGLDYVKHFGDELIETVEIERTRIQFESLTDILRRTKMPRRELENLILAGAVDYMGERRDLLWDIAEAYHLAKRPKETPLPLEKTPEQKVRLKPLSAMEKLQFSFAVTGVSVEQHIAALKQNKFEELGARSIKDVRSMRTGTKVKVGGLITIKQLPASAKGVCFLAIEDAHGLMNVTIPVEIYDKYEEEIRAFGVIEGEVRRKRALVYLVAKAITAV